MPDYNTKILMCLYMYKKGVMPNIKWQRNVEIKNINRDFKKRKRCRCEYKELLSRIPFQENRNTSDIIFHEFIYIIFLGKK